MFAAGVCVLLSGAVLGRVTCADRISGRAVLRVLLLQAPCWFWGAAGSFGWLVGTEMGPADVTLRDFGNQEEQDGCCRLGTVSWGLCGVLEPPLFLTPAV